LKVGLILGWIGEEIEFWCLWWVGFWKRNLLKGNNNCKKNHPEWWILRVTEVFFLFNFMTIVYGKEKERIFGEKIVVFSSSNESFVSCVFVVCWCWWQWWSMTVLIRFEFFLQKRRMNNGFNFFFFRKRDDIVFFYYNFYFLFFWV